MSKVFRSHSWLEGLVTRDVFSLMSSGTISGLGSVPGVTVVTKPSRRRHPTSTSLTVAKQAPAEDKIFRFWPPVIHGLEARPSTLVGHLADPESHPEVQFRDQCAPEIAPLTVVDSLAVKNEVFFRTVTLGVINYAGHTF